ncbi:MAG: acyl-CoA desaturase [Bryobacterales bacterium]|nr:acyl-CoA desaturase [Bryobacterales bacterium]
MPRYAPISRDSFLTARLYTYHYMPTVILGVVLLVFGGLLHAAVGAVFPDCLRTACHLASGLAAHMFGTRRFETKDLSTNSWWVALLTFGEGWHNNHHAHPTSARHGLVWWEVDMTWMQIKLLEKLGIASMVREASADGRSSRATKAGAMNTSHES